MGNQTARNMFDVSGCSYDGVVLIIVEVEHGEDHGAPAHSHVPDVCTRPAALCDNIPTCSYAFVPLLIYHNSLLHNQSSCSDVAGSIGSLQWQAITATEGSW